MVFQKRNLASKTLKYVLFTETYIQLGFKDRSSSYSGSPCLVEWVPDTSLNTAFNRSFWFLMTNRKACLKTLNKNQYTVHRWNIWPTYSQKTSYVYFKTSPCLGTFCPGVNCPKEICQQIPGHLSIPIKHMGSCWRAVTQKYNQQSCALCSSKDQC